jgi:alkylation response protein AidB-like acyl-CoA dehydrogenase
MIAVTPPGFERELGDPEDAGGAFSYSRIMELDGREEFPALMCAELDRLGMASYYVPARYGGKMASVADTAWLVRCVARRDLTAAVAHAKTFLGAAPVWVAGSPEQAANLARRVLTGTVVALGLTERGHGSDLLGTEVTAIPDGDGLRVDGEKWLINNATRSHLVCVLARSGGAGGAPGLSLVLVDKAVIGTDAFRCTPKVPTHGIRGADISGIELVGARVATGDVVGQPGSGLRTLLKSFQLTRTLCAALSLGAADQALALAVRFCAERELYGGRLIDLPSVRATLGAAVATLFVVESASMLAYRAVSTLTGEMSVISAAVKSLVPTAVDELIDSLGELLGARAFLTSEFAGGRFQKVERDHRIVGIFDGSTFVNQDYLISQFHRLAAGYRGRRVDAAGLRAAARLGERVGEPDLAALCPLSWSGCSPVQALPEAVAAVRDLRMTGEVTPAAAELAGRLLSQVDDLHHTLLSWRQQGRELPPYAFILARRYEWVFAGAACLLLWLENRDRASDHPLWPDGRWLEPCLGMILARLGQPPAALDRALIALFDQVDAAAPDRPVAILPGGAGDVG